jgi:branched-chain amino acid transport system permease protein
VKHRLSRYIAGVVVLMILVAAHFGGDYYVDALTMLLINAILVVGFRFIALSGEMSFCHVALMGAGAYTTALMTAKWGWPFWVSLPLAGVAPALIALILSYPLLRLKQFYFAMGSFAAGEAMRLSWSRFKLFGGYDGIYNIPPPSFPGIDFHNLTAYYFLTIVLVVLCLVVMYRLENSGIGFTIKAIAAQDFLAQSIGVSIRKYKTFAFITGSFFAGIAGALYAHRMAWVDPFHFTFTYNLYILVWVLFGGLGSFAGPLIGLLSLTVVDEVIHSISGLEPWIPFIYGGLMIVTLLVMPQGLFSLLKRILSGVRKRL